MIADVVAVAAVVVAEPSAVDASAAAVPHQAPLHLPAHQPSAEAYSA